MSAQVQPIGVLTSTPPATAALVWLLATGAGVGMASVYYSQSILPLMQRSLGVAPERMILVPVIAQAGYAIGMLLLAPLGDLIERRRLVIGPVSS